MLTNTGAKGTVSHLRNLGACKFTTYKITLTEEYVESIKDGTAEAFILSDEFSQFDNFPPSLITMTTTMVPKNVEFTEIEVDEGDHITFKISPKSAINLFRAFVEGQRNCKVGDSCEIFRVHGNDNTEVIFYC